MRCRAVNDPFVDASLSASKPFLPPPSASLDFGWVRAPSDILANNHHHHNHDFLTDLPVMSRMCHSQLERKLDSALTKVPTSYICNRCKGRGHYVSDCPTNEDPKYDITAGFDYICKFCKQRGTHYFLFCPRNPDPNSIYKRRQARSFQCFQTSPLSTDPGPKTPFLSPAGSLDSLESATLSRSKIIVPTFPNPNDNFDYFTEMRRTGSRDPTTGHLEKYNGCDDTKYCMRSFGTDESRDNIAPKDERSEVGCCETFELFEGEVVWEKRKNQIQGEPSINLQKQPEIPLSNRAFIERTVAEVTVVPATQQSPHAEFLSKLLVNHPSQPNRKWRLRMTAMEMWDIDDERKCREVGNDGSCLSEGEISTESCNQKNTMVKIATDHSSHGHSDFMDVDAIEDSSSWKTQEEQIDLLIYSMGFEEYEEEQDESSVLREEKLRAIQKKINSIEDLRTKLVSGEDVELPEMEQIASGALSQAKLEEISGRMRAAESPSSSSRNSSSSGLSSPQRLSSGSDWRGGSGYRQE